MTYWLELSREDFKFSCAHMTIFPDGSKERLHGHNYQVSLRVGLKDVSFQNLVPFSDIKKAVRNFCLDFKEYLLIQEKNPLVDIVSDDGKVLEVHVCGVRYVLPRNEVKLLPLDNITVECLASYVAEMLLAKLGDKAKVLTDLQVSVHESPGQGATFSTQCN